MSGKDENAGDVMTETGRQTHGNQGARGRRGRASFFSLGSDLDGDLAREPSLSINPARSHMGV